MNMVEQWVATCDSRQAAAVGEVISALSELLLPERHDPARSLQPFFAHALSPPVTADLHFDTYDNILWVILGRKRVWLLHRGSLPRCADRGHGSLERTARYPSNFAPESPVGLQRARAWRDVVHPLRVLALRPLRPQYACHQPVVLPSRGRSPPPSGGRRWPPDSRGTGHAQASADTVVLPFIFQRVGRLRLPLAIYISYASTIAVIFHDSPCSCCVYLYLYVCALSTLFHLFRRRQRYWSTFVICSADQLE